MESAPGATIILFGSRARGDAREGSDLDFMVVEPEVKARREEMERLRLAVGRIVIPAVLASQGVDYPLTHDLEHLFELMLNQGVSVPATSFLSCAT
jgi:predicted nucleotidyltransferase